MERSGLSPNAFATREGIDVQRLYRWRQRLAGEGVVVDAEPEFIELRPRGLELVEVVLLSGRLLRVSERIAPSTLAQLVAVLERHESC
jgi:hypothetical protein